MCVMCYGIGLEGSVRVQVLDRTIKVDYKIPSKPKVSQAAVDFIDKLLQGDPQKRLTIQGVYEHPWFKTNLPGNVTPPPFPCGFSACWEPQCPFCFPA